MDFSSKAISPRGAEGGRGGRREGGMGEVREPGGGPKGGGGNKPELETGQREGVGRP